MEWVGRHDIYDKQVLPPFHNVVMNLNGMANHLEEQYKNISLDHDMYMCFHSQCTNVMDLAELNKRWKAKAS
jgi:hypothetical protein